jgi:TatD DNase family protein
VEFKTQEESFDYEKYKELARSSKKVVAVGEIGLDYYYKPKTNVRLESFKNKQKEVFSRQLDLAKELDLPVIFHCRMAHDEMIDILGNYENLKGTIHCFTGTLEQAEKYLKMGFYIGLNGIIFKFNIDEIIKKIPLDKILIETDCPYLTPPPMAGRNEPLFVKYVAGKVAQLKSLSVEEIAGKTTENAKKLFKI